MMEIGPGEIKSSDNEQHGTMLMISNVGGQGTYGITIVLVVC